MSSQTTQQALPTGTWSGDTIHFTVDSLLRNEQVAVIGASAGMFGAVWAQAELRKVMPVLQAVV